MGYLREESRLEYRTREVNASIEELKAGSLQRIADAAEKMAASYDALRADRDRYKAWYERERATNRTLRNRIAGLRGALNQVKRGR